MPDCLHAYHSPSTAHLAAMLHHNTKQSILTPCASRLHMCAWGTDLAVVAGLSMGAEAVQDGVQQLLRQLLAQGSRREHDAAQVQQAVGLQRLLLQLLQNFCQPPTCLTTLLSADPGVTARLLAAAGLQVAAYMGTECKATMQGMASCGAATGALPACRDWQLGPCKEGLLRVEAAADHSCWTVARATSD